MLPLLAIIVIIYNLFVALTIDLAASVFSLTMPSGGIWTLTVGDLLVAIAIILLFAELVMSSNARSVAMVNHALSLLVFIVCLVEFLLVEPCATSTFFLIMLLTLVDVVVGYSVSVTAARRDFAVSRDEAI
jgi:hypothetical protein